MKKRNEISCTSREEMKTIADRMVEEGYSVKAVEQMTPFQQYGACIPMYKVIFWKDQRKAGTADRLFFLKKYLRRSLWKSDSQRISALSESSAL